ncbi:MAG: hypothetical protein J6N19_17035 [Clostridium sp.]|nr:hypothetical protein [Clostridium sp.]
MAEYGYVAAQTLQPGAAAILENIRPCNKCPQNVIHDDMTPNLTLRGIVRNPCCNARAQYNVSFSGNIAVSEGGAAGEIQLALSVNGFIRPLTIAAATPAAAEEYWHVSGDTTIDVAVGCCTEVAVVNASVSATPATTPAPAIDVRNLNVKVTRIA